MLLAALIIAWLASFLGMFRGVIIGNSSVTVGFTLLMLCLTFALASYVEQIF